MKRGSTKAKARNPLQTASIVVSRYHPTKLCTREAIIHIGEKHIVIAAHHIDLVQRINPMAVRGE
jgi:hypothetical protein